MKNLLKLKVFLIVFAVIFATKTFGGDNILPLPKPIIDKDLKLKISKKKQIYPEKKPS